MLDRLKELCLISGVSGEEDLVAEYIIRQIGGKALVTRDNLGNLLVFKKGKKRPKHKIMICAHMDEVGFIITGVTADGMLRFAAVGGIDVRVIIGRAVNVGTAGYPGVIGTKPIHLQSDSERGGVPEIDSLYIDIGALSEEDARTHIMPGDRAVFCSEFFAFGDGMLKSKAIDDRAGCAILLELIDSDLAYDMHFAFTVQEEIGLRGARTAAFGINPDMALVVETTTAADVAGVEADKQVCRLGEGPVVSFMDRSTIYDKKLYALAFATAKDNGIPCQTKSMIAGGNDSGAVHVSTGGVRTTAISIPCRYLHSPSCVIKIADMEQTLLLVEKMMEKMSEIK